jgi:AraC-like DNA-binding protein
VFKIARLLGEFLTFDVKNMTICAMAAVAHQGALIYLATYLRNERLPVPPRLERHVRWAKIAENAVDAVSPALIIEALEESAALAGRYDLGFSFAQWVNSRGFGPLSLLGEQCPTLRYALEARRRYLHVVNGAYFIELRQLGNELHVRHDVLSSFREKATQFLAGVTVLAVRLARRALGAHWNPLRVELGGARPSDPRGYEHFFRCPISFGAEHFTVVFSVADGERPLPGYDPEMLALIEHHLEILSTKWPTGLVEQIERLILANIESGFGNVETIAGIMATSPRTLQRQLSELGTSFSEILDRVRKETVLAFFRENPRRPVILLAHLLGYSDASTVSRFISGHFGMSSQVLRRQIAGEHRPTSR